MTKQEAIEDPKQQTLSIAAPVVAHRATMARRHLVLKMSFVGLVLLPTALAIYYLFVIAADQYHSEAAFSVRSEEYSNPLEALSAFTQTGANSAPDSELIYDYIVSQPMIEAVDAKLNLREMFNKPDGDYVFSLGEEQTIEKLIDYWKRMVRVSLDGSTGVLEIETRAFTPQDATAIAQEIIRLSSNLVDDLSRIAREDVLKFTLFDLRQAEERLKEQRRKIREFRLEYQIIDPEADVESQVGVISALQASLATALVQYETILSSSDEGDPRLRNLERELTAIRKQIAKERQAVSGAVGEYSLSDVIGRYEELLVDREFSENAYTAALAAEEQARMEARRKNRYVAVHIPATLAEEAIYPQREILSFLVFACLLAFWGVMVLVYYNIRDRS